MILLPGKFNSSASIFFLAINALLFFPVGLVASETAQVETAGGEETYHKHALGLFVGNTHEHHKNLSTFGIEYSYRFNKNWSVGGVIERADREEESTLGIIFVHFWPYKGLYLGAGIGRKDPEEARENTVRATIGYEFEFGEGWIISPQANLDFIKNEEREEVFGIVFGKQF